MLKLKYPLMLLVSLWFFMATASCEEALKTYTNEGWGYSISYPETYRLIDDPKILKRIMQVGADKLLSKPEDAQTHDVVQKISGQQFMILVPPEEGEKQNATLNLIIEQVGVAGYTNESYFQAAVSYLPKIHAQIVGKAKKVTIQGLPFNTIEYLLQAPDSTLKNRVYSYYDSTSRTAYVFNVAGRQGVDEAGIESLNKVMKSFKLKFLPTDFPGESG